MNADNICGCLIETRPENGPRVAAEVAKAPGAEVHAVEGGKLVVTVEDAGETLASETIMALHQIPGVLTVTLTAHYFEPRDARPVAEHQ